MCLNCGKPNSGGLLPIATFFLRANEQKEVALGSEFQNKKTKIHPVVSKAVFKPLYILKEFYFGGGP